jgi:hypothetical protein
MVQKTTIMHIALNYPDKEKADVFFIEILNLKLQKSFSLNPDLSKQIFNLSEQVDVFVYGDDFTVFEVFITEKKVRHSFEHVCIKIDDKKEFIEKCKKYRLKIYQVNKDEKKLLFVKDFSGNLYEVK